MRRSTILSIGILASLVLGACASSTPAALQPSLSVTGVGTIHLQPDVATVNVGVHTQDPEVSRAVSTNNESTRAVIDATRGLGVADADIQTTYFSVMPQQQYDSSGFPTGQVTYWVDNTLTISLRKIDQLGALLQAVLKAGANNVQGVTFGVQDPSQAQSQARAQAMVDARARAGLLAAEAGRTLGEATAISTTISSPGPYYFPAAYGIGGGGGGVPVSTGTLDVQVQVTVTYQLK
jgi:uncharacterized protein YggE